MDDRNRKIVAAAATDLVNRIGSEIDYIFKPRYTEFAEGKKEQTNAYANLDPNEQSEVVLEGLLLTLAQIGASAVAQGNTDMQTVSASMSKRLKQHIDTYHQIFLHMKETQDEIKHKGTEAGNVGSDANVSGDGC